MKYILSLLLHLYDRNPPKYQTEKDTIPIAIFIGFLIIFLIWLLSSSNKKEWLLLTFGDAGLKETSESAALPKSLGGVVVRLALSSVN